MARIRVPKKDTHFPLDAVVKGVGAENFINLLNPVVGEMPGGGTRPGATSGPSLVPTPMR